MNLLELPLSLSANARPKRCGCVAIACGVAWQSNLLVSVHCIHIAFTLPGLVLWKRCQVSGWVSWLSLHLVRFLLSLCCWVCVAARMFAWLIPLVVFPTPGCCR